MTQTTILMSMSDSPPELLKSLKNLKNSVIGNAWKKVEVTEDEELLGFLLGLLDSSELDPTRIDIVIETAVILGALANVGPLTLRPLLQGSTPSHLLSLIKSLLSSSLPRAQYSRLLPPVLRALRNVLITTADLVWGHMWGVGAEKKVVGTGLVGERIIHEIMAKSKSNGKGRSWRVEATRALNLSFEANNLNTLISLIQRYPDPQILLPIYQLFSRLIALPSHRESLARWQPQGTSTSSLTSQYASAGPSVLRLELIAPNPPLFILDHLLNVIASSYSSPAGRRVNGKILEAALDLLAALVKGQCNMAATVKSWRDESVFLDKDEMDIESAEPPNTTFISILVDMLLAGPTPVRIASANCLTNILKADKTARTFERVRASVMNLQLLDVIVKLLKSEGLEERVKLCFILAALVSDDANLQKSAADQGCPTLLVTMITELDRDEQNGEIGNNIASRSKEAVLLALAALSFSHEPTRSYLAEASPPFLPYLHRALSDPSYGVRAAACQLARALSRTVAILRTSLVDSGVGEEVIETLKREVAARRRKSGIDTPTDGLNDDEVARTRLGLEEEDDLGDRAWTVEVAATATICNLITDFSPLRSVLARGGGVEILCQLAHSPYEPLALNALWAIKNLIFRAIEPMKNHVMGILGWDSLQFFIGRGSPISLRIQALEITQNLLADAVPSEVTRCLDSLGESELLETLAGAAREGEDVELRVPALFVLANLALGNERTRSAMVTKVEILEVLSEAMNAKVDLVKVPAIRTIRHLIESNAKTHRPRQAMLDLFQPYQLRSRLKDLAELSPSLDVCQASIGLLEVLDRGKESGGNGSAIVGSAPR